MSTENTPVDTSDDLDLFSEDFFGQKPTPEAATSEDHDNEDDAPLETPQETPAEEDNEEDFIPEDKPKKSRFQERIDEVVGKQREAERKLAEALLKLDELQTKPVIPAKAEPTSDEPNPNAINEDGTEKYPLGEFDPNYIRDLTVFSNEQWLAKTEAKKAEEAKRAVEDAERAVLQTEWNGKLDTARERYPDFQEKGVALTETFAGINQAYGDYLGTTLMNMENGTEVLYYLANNVDVAQEIVNSGPQKATIALGRLDAKFAKDSEQETRRVSKAPTPPPTNKGAAVSKPEIDDDTDDLDAFAQKFFKRRK